MPIRQLGFLMWIFKRGLGTGGLLVEVRITLGALLGGTTSIMPPRSRSTSAPPRLARHDHGSP